MYSTLMLNLVYPITRPEVADFILFLFISVGGLIIGTWVIRNGLKNS